MNLEELIKEIHSLNEEDYLKIVDLLTEEEYKVLVYGNYKIYVYGEPQANPSFHIYNRSKETNAVYTIRDFLPLDFSPRRKFLSSSKIRNLKQWLKEKDEHGVQRVIYLVQHWNQMNPKYPVELKDINW